MRKCSTCQIDKNLEDFHRKGSGYSYMCKECRKKYIRNHYQNNKAKYIQKAKEGTKRSLEAYKKMKSTLRCEKCGENHPATLDFHHLDPSKKDIEVPKLFKSSKKLKAELEKCIVLCSNCHRKLHYEEKMVP